MTPRRRVQGGAGKARSSSDKKELERLLRHGAYDLFNKDAEQVLPLLRCNCNCSYTAVTSPPRDIGRLGIALRRRAALRPRQGGDRLRRARRRAVCSTRRTSNRSCSGARPRLCRAALTPPRRAGGFPPVPGCALALPGSRLQRMLCAGRSPLSNLSSAHPVRSSLSAQHLFDGVVRPRVRGQRGGLQRPRLLAQAHAGSQHGAAPH